MSSETETPAQDLRLEHLDKVVGGKGYAGAITLTSDAAVGADPGGNLGHAGPGAAAAPPEVRHGVLIAKLGAPA